MAITTIGRYPQLAGVPDGPGHVVDIEALGGVGLDGLQQPGLGHRQVIFVGAPGGGGGQAQQARGPALASRGPALTGLGGRGPQHEVRHCSICV